MKRLSVCTPIVFHDCEFSIGTWPSEIRFARTIAIASSNCEYQSTALGCPGIGFLIGNPEIYTKEYFHGSDQR